MDPKNMETADIITLDQPTAASMTALAGLIKLYGKLNKNGKYDDALKKDTSMYKHFMDEVLGRNEEASAAVAA